MKYVNKLVILVAIVGMVFSCTEVVDVEVPNGGDRLVVEASINWEKGTDGKQQVINLSMSTPYFAKERMVPVTTAKVTVVKDDDLQEIVFESQNDGSYVTTSFIPEVNQSYTLKIENNGNVYHATETLISAPEIKRTEITKKLGISKETPEVVFYFDDPPKEENFYLEAFYFSGSPIPELTTISDRFNEEGKEMKIWYEEEFEKDDVITASLVGISEAYYNYMNIFFAQQQQGGPFQVTPAQMIGNCKNINDPKEEVFGYFRLSEVSTVIEVIE